MKNFGLFLILFCVVSSPLKAQVVANTLYSHDTRYVNDAPNFFSQSIRLDFKERSVIGVPGAGIYSGNMTIAPWDHASGGLNHQLNFNDGGIFYRTGSHSSATWNPWQKLLIQDASGDVWINGKLKISGSGDTGVPIEIYNQSKVLSGQGHTWRIFNMTGQYGNSLQFWAYDQVNGCAGGLCTSRLVLMDNGNVGIGIGNPANRLEVNGTIRAKEVKVETINWPDFVFTKDHQLLPLHEVKHYISENKHLPGIPAETEVKENGVNLGDMQAKLLQKIEELTLYAIQQQEMIDRLNDKIEKLENERK